MYQSETCSVRATARTEHPRFPYAAIKDAVLGKDYDLSLVFVGDKLSRELNKKHRGKTYAPNVLSFPYGKIEGEIFINLRTAAKEAKKLKTTFKKRVALLYVHGLYHLKGLDHSDHMEAMEQETLKRFDLA